MADFRGSDAPYLLTDVAPITSARVNELTDESDVVIGHDYEFGFVVAGDYSLGYTCVAQNDDPEAANTPDDATDAFFIHIDEQAVEVVEGATTERHFPEGFVPAT